MRERTTDPEYRQTCQGNLTRIFDALGQYVERYGTLPNWLYDLFPEFIDDRNVVICPYVAKTGQFLEWRKGLFRGEPDKGPPTYYHYEFYTNKLSRVEPDDAGKTYRDYKEAQRRLLGDAVPVVRCLAHDPGLNLAYNGLIFDNIDPVYWEESFAHIYPHMALIPRDVFRITRQIDASSPQFAHGVASGSATLLDLREYFNITLHSNISLHTLQDSRGKAFKTNNLAKLPRGIQNFGGVDFNISGVLHLTRGSRNLPFPREVHGIEVNQRCSRIHVLHGFVASEIPSTEAGRIAVHYGGAPNPSNRVTVVPVPGTSTEVVWQALIQEPKLKDRTVVIYRSTWHNPEPTQDIETLSFVSAMTEAAPFLLAVTLE